MTVNQYLDDTGRVIGLVANGQRVHHNEIYNHKFRFKTDQGREWNGTDEELAVIVSEVRGTEETAMLEDDVIQEEMRRIG